MWSELTDRSIDSWPCLCIWVESDSGCRDKGTLPEVPILEMQPPQGDESFTERSEWGSHPQRGQELPEPFLFGAEGLSGALTDRPPPNLCLALLFVFSLGVSTFCIEVCTKQNSSSVKWKSSRLFARCTVPFVQSADLGEGAQNIMPASLGKHIQTMVCV